METKFKKLSPNLMVQNVENAIKFYVEILGFTLIMSVKESENPNQKVSINKDSFVYALIKKNDIEIMLQREDTLKDDLPNVFTSLNIGATVSFYFEVDDIKPIYDDLKNKTFNNKSINFVKDLHKTWYGADEFYITDSDGYILCFGAMSE